MDELAKSHETAFAAVVAICIQWKKVGCTYQTFSLGPNSFMPLVKLDREKKT